MRMPQAEVFSLICSATLLSVSIPTVYADELDRSDTEAPGALTAGSSHGVEEVVVTARRREESTRDVPFTVVAIPNSDMERFSIGNMASLPLLTPGFTVTSFAGHAQPYIRGVGTDANSVGTEPSVALYVDGVYQPRGDVYLQELNDIESVEILKGPQGTLYGRNATGGSITITTKRPEPGFNAIVDLTAGNGDLLSSKFYVAGGDGELRASFAGYQRKADGFVTNLVTGNQVGKRDEWSVRGKILWLVNDASELTLSVDHTEVEGGYGYFMNVLGDTRNVFATTVPGACYSMVPRKVCTDEEERMSEDFNWKEITGGTARWQTYFEDFDLVITGGYRRIENVGSFDFDATSAPLLFVANAPYPGEDTRYWSLEPQLISTGDGRVNWLFGGVYDEFKSEVQVTTDVGAPAGGPIATRSHPFPTGAAWALYGQLGYKLGPEYRWSISAGARYSRETKGVENTDRWTVNGGIKNGVAGPVTRDPDVETTWSNTLGNIEVNYTFSDDVTGYARVAQGFKSGAYQVNNPTIPPVDPEEITSAEIGIKSAFVDGRMQLDVSAFRYWYEDLQVRRIGNDGIIRLQNAAKASVNGIEAALRSRPIWNADVRVALTYLDATYDSFPNASISEACRDLGIAVSLNCTPGTGAAAAIPAPDLAGNMLMRAPKLTANLAASYLLGPWELAGVAAYSSKYYFDPNERVMQPAFTTVNLSLTYRPASDAWYIRAWGDNVTDQDYIGAFLSSAFSDAASWADPRTYGITVGFRFGERDQ